MAEAAVIGLSGTGYTGNAALGGGSFGSFQLDTKPIEDLARYTMLFNKAEYDQRQKDAEKAADEIADLTSFDLTSGIPKDAKLLSDKYDKITAYVRENPNALDYRNKKEWTEYNRMKNDLDNDLRGAKVRNTMFALRQKEVQDEKDPALRKLMQEELDREISETDIRTPIKHSQQYNDKLPEIPAVGSVKFDVWAKLPNDNVQRKYQMLDVPGMWGKAVEMDLRNKAIDVDASSPDGKRIAIAKSNNVWNKSAEVINAIIPKAIGADGKVDPSKLDRTSAGVYAIAQEYNKYVREKKAEIASGVYTDAIGKPIQFGPNGIKEDDYREIVIEDGIDGVEMAVIAMFAKSPADAYETELKQTDNAIQLSGQAVTKRGQDIAASTADKNRAEDARQFDEANKNKGGGKSGNTQTSGNAFDEIGGTTEVEVTGGGGVFGKGKAKISNGYVYDKKGNLHTGKVRISADLLPAGMIGALKVAGTEVAADGTVEVTAKGGTIISVKAEGGNVISRQDMENAQKKFDTEQQGQERTQWGRTLETPITTEPKKEDGKWDKYKTN